jgi:hypothetical protein
MLYRSWFHLRVVLYVVCIVALLTACTAEFGAVQEDDDELVTRSVAEDDRRLYREVQAIRDKLNRDLTKQLTDLRFISP